MSKIKLYLMNHKRMGLSLILLFITVASAAVIPREYLPNSYLNDKMQHTLVFAALTVLLSFKRKWLFTYLCISLTVLGGVMELLQPLIGRQSELADFIANSIGVFIIYVPVFLFKCLFEKKRYKYIVKVPK